MNPAASVRMPGWLLLTPTLAMKGSGVDGYSRELDILTDVSDLLLQVGGVFVRVKGIAPWRWHITKNVPAPIVIANLYSPHLVGQLGSSRFTCDWRVFCTPQLGWMSHQANLLKNCRFVLGRLEIFPDPRFNR